MVDPWTDDELAKLKALYNARDYTYEAMAEQLGKSRSSIAGKIGRLRAAQRRKLAKQGKPTKVKRKSPGKPAWTRFKPVRPAPKAHPFFRQIIALMNEHQISRRELCKRVGMSEFTFDNYRTRDVPKLTLLEALFNVLGKTIAVVNIAED